MNQKQETKGEEAMEMFKLIKAQGMLPATLDKLVPMSFIGQAAVKFYQTKIRLMTQLKMTEEQRQATLRDGQDAGEMLLDIEGRIGELLPSPEEAQAHGRTQAKVHGRTGKDDGRILPEGITSKKAHQARAIKDNPEIVERVKAQARENEDIPTKTAVLNAIEHQKDIDRIMSRTPKEKKKPDFGEYISTTLLHAQNLLLGLTELVEYREAFYSEPYVKLFDRKILIGHLKSIKQKIELLLEKEGK